jgi:hypothetical protein
MGQLRKANTADQMQQFRLPAPTGGINAVDPGTELPARDCFYSYNTIATEQGVRARTGWREYCTNLTGTYTNEVKCTIPYHGSSLTNSKLFQTTDKGIWDVSASGSAPTLVYSFATVSPNSGWGVAAAVVTSAGHFLLYADEVNGLHYYSETTATWAAYATGTGTGQISGPAPTDIVSVTVWKNRVWVTEKSTASAWYLDINAIFGTATEFNFGGRFKHGGSLVGLFNWSINAGDGLDTSLVGISTGGDVVIYVGTNPASADTFALKGVWYVGAVPAGRTIASDVGGDLLIISALGVVPLSRLVLGDPDRLQYATAKVGPLFARLALNAMGLRGWALHTHPTDNALVVLVPQVAGDETIQLAMALGARSWSQYRDLPILSAAVWQGELYFGTADGRCGRNVGSVDGVTLADTSSGTAIDWSVLMRYAGDGRQKQVQMVRPILVAEETAPTVVASARYDFSQSEPSEPSLVDAGIGTWNYGIAQGTLAQGESAGASELTITQTDGTFPSTGSAVVFDQAAAGEQETVGIGAFDSGTGVMQLTGTLTYAHAIGDVVLVVTADDGSWGNALWGGANKPTSAIKGAVGMGRDVAIAIRGQARARTTLVGVDVLFTVGGWL